MKIKYSSIIPFKGFYAINLYGTMYIRKEFKDSPLKLDEYDINHEEIHSAQARDFCKINWIGYTIFYIFYFLFWLVELVRPPYDEAYHDICFEKEAYIHENNLDYLKQRTRWCWLKKKYWRNYEEPRKNKTKKYNQ